MGDTTRLQQTRSSLWTEGPRFRREPSSSALAQVSAWVVARQSHVVWTVGSVVWTVASPLAPVCCARAAPMSAVISWFQVVSSSRDALPLPVPTDAPASAAHLDGVRASASGRVWCVRTSACRPCGPTFLLRTAERSMRAMVSPAHPNSISSAQMDSALPPHEPSSGASRWARDRQKLNPSAQLRAEAPTQHRGSGVSSFYPHAPRTSRYAIPVTIYFPHGSRSKLQHRLCLWASATISCRLQDSNGRSGASSGTSLIPAPDRATSD